MKLLLDTHIWLWYLQGNNRLSENLQELMSASDTELWLSPISVWETLILAEKGRIELDSEPIVWVKKYLRSLDFKEARLTYEISMRSRQLELSHQDPADRFIAATAVELDLTLATMDRRLVSLNWLLTIS
ncbi:type II toxin-antitoxin system VapC family toxin [Pleurocapsa sp. PCC 7319]|uniref:type II toxin-antitoxin system VapC family toxin n=1 Tax=Pleurocapsa sp. PCC 7319 TaxID=118161 RepID=UPI0003462E80|nr:type II toxin-antitoxin system VapC family toxin [Pleurocapsa sp. PCC 7319]